VGALKQALKGHRKYKYKINPNTGHYYTSLLERYDNDVVYRFRMLCQGWMRDMIPGLQELLEKPRFGGRISHRTRAQIEEAETSYVANADLPGTEWDDAWVEAEHAHNPDWKQTKEVRHKFMAGLWAHSHLDDPVEPWVGDILAQQFNVERVAVIAPESEEQSSASFAKGAKEGRSSSSAAAADAWWQPTDTAAWWEASGSGASWQQTDTAAWWEPSGCGRGRGHESRGEAEERVALQRALEESAREQRWHYDARHYKKGWW
jgi:hypothetical protein